MGVHGPDARVLGHCAREEGTDEAGGDAEAAVGRREEQSLDVEGLGSGSGGVGSVGVGIGEQ